MTRIPFSGSATEHPRISATPADQPAFDGPKRRPEWQSGRFFLLFSREYPITKKQKANAPWRCRAAGFKLYWARAENVPEYVDLKGWDEVIWDDPRSGPVYLRVRDPYCEYVALLQKREHT